MVVTSLGLGVAVGGRPRWDTASWHRDTAQAMGPSEVGVDRWQAEEQDCPPVATSRTKSQHLIMFSLPNTVTGVRRLTMGL